MGIRSKSDRCPSKSGAARPRTAHWSRSSPAARRPSSPPIGRVRSRDGEFVIADGEAGPVTMALRQALLDIQYGKAPDKHNWMHRV